MENPLQQTFENDAFARKFRDDFQRILRERGEEAANEFASAKFIAMLLLLMSLVEFARG